MFLMPVRFLPQVFNHMILRQANPHDFYPENFNHAFLPKPDFEEYRNNSRKEFEEIQNYIGDEEFHQEPDHPSIFMKMVKKGNRQCQLYMMKGAKYYLQKSSGMEP
jgi:hypothetical protein